VAVVEFIRLILLLAQVDLVAVVLVASQTFQPTQAELLTQVAELVAVATVTVLLAVQVL
jgi:hypothetical protein